MFLQTHMIFNFKKNEQRHQISFQECASFFSATVRIVGLPLGDLSDTFESTFLIYFTWM